MNVLRTFMDRLSAWLESASANIKLVDQALSGMQGSYVELLTLLALGLLAVIPIIVPERHRQFYRRLNQCFGILIFIFVVYTCLGVFGMIRNFHRGLMEIGRENIIALYFCSVPLTVLVTSMIFGPTFCGWICPTGALQEFIAIPLKRWHRARRKAGWPCTPAVLTLTGLVTLVFLGWMAYLSVTRVFFVEDASVYWSEVLVILLFVLAFRMARWDKALRRLRWVSFAIIAAGAVAGWRITSPVHFTFSKVYDPASVLSTIMVVLGAILVPQIWCRYLCPWREAIAWAGRHSVRRLETRPDACTQCGQCDSVCGVEAVHHGTVDPHECHLCLKCVDTCPTKAIRLTDQWKAEP